MTSPNIVGRISLFFFMILPSFKYVYFIILKEEKNTSLSGKLIKKSMISPKMKILSKKFYEKSFVCEIVDKYCFLQYNRNIVLF